MCSALLRLPRSLFLFNGEAIRSHGTARLSSCYFAWAAFFWQYSFYGKPREAQMRFYPCKCFDARRWSVPAWNRYVFLRFISLQLEEPQLNTLPKFFIQFSFVPAIVSLAENNETQKNSNDNPPKIVLFGMSGCFHCSRFSPRFVTVAPIIPIKRTFCHEIRN